MNTTNLARSVLLGLLVGGGTAAARALDDECQAGLAAFAATVHTKVLRDCALCHNGATVAPPFAVADVNASYFRLLNYTDFNAPERSTLGVRAGNGHCQLANCDTASGQEMIGLIQRWWTEGQSQCQTPGRFFTAEVPVPSDLPDVTQGFRPLRFDLGAISGALTGVTLAVDAQVFARPSAQAPGAYRFQRPRLEGGKGPLHIADLKVLVNRRYDQLATGFTGIDTAVAPNALGSYPLLSTALVEVVQDGMTADRLSLSFADIAPTTKAASCEHVDLFHAKVAPTLTAGDCGSCHGDQTRPGTPVARAALDMAVPEAELCDAMLQRVTRAEVLLSPLVGLPLRGAFGHPTSLPNPTSVLRAWLDWMTVEGVPTRRRDASITLAPQPTTRMEK